MRTILTILTLVMATVAMSAQHFTTTRGVATPSWRVDNTWTFKKADTVTTDTVTSPVVNLFGSFYPASPDTVHRINGGVINKFDTCTYTIAYFQCGPNGENLSGGSWTNIVTAQQLLPGVFFPWRFSVPITTQYVKFRAIRTKGSTQRVDNTAILYIYRF